MKIEESAPDDSEERGFCYGPPGRWLCCSPRPTGQPRVSHFISTSQSERGAEMGRSRQLRLVSGPVGISRLARALGQLWWEVRELPRTPAAGSAALERLGLRPQSPR